MNYVLTILIQSTALHTAIHSVLSSASAWYSTARFNSVIQSTHLLNSHTHIHHTHFCYTCVVFEIFCYLSHSFICLSVFLCQAQMLIMIERLVFHNGTSYFITYLALEAYLASFLKYPLQHEEASILATWSAAISRIPFQKRIIEFL